MRIFSRLYDKTLAWSRHRHAPMYLAGVSFAESSFFPVPPDVMLVTMGMAAPHRSFRFALLATLFSVAGGILGYLIGYFAMEWIEPWLLKSSLSGNYAEISGLFSRYGVWIVFLAGFTPLPYKVFTITAGAMQMAILPFAVASLIGRGARFFLVSGLMYLGGARLQEKLRTWIEVIGWGTLLVVVALIIGLRWG